MPFYQLTQHGSYLGNDIVNVHWYRSITPYGSLLDRVAIMEALAAEFQTDVWNSRAPAFIGGYGLQDLLPTGYTLVDLTMQAWDDAIVAFTSDPVVVPVGSAGLVNELTNGPAPCCVFRANLAPAAGPGIGLPKKGYLAIGPLCDTMIGGNGSLNTADLAHFQSLADRMSLSIMTEAPPDELEPIRVKLTRVGGVVTDIGYKTVNSWLVRPIATFRRSRLPEIGS